MSKKFEVTDWKAFFQLMFTYYLCKNNLPVNKLTKREMSRLVQLGIYKRLYNNDLKLVIENAVKTLKNEYETKISKIYK